MGKIASKEIRVAALKARAEGITVAKISQVLGKTMRTLFRWFKDYSETGKDAPARRGHPKRGVDDSQMQQIEALLCSSPDITAE